MYDVYVNDQDHSDRVVVKYKAGIPPHLARKKWKLARQGFIVTGDIARDVDINGFYQYTSNVSIEEIEIVGILPPAK